MFRRPALERGGFFGASGEGDVATVGHLNAIRNGHMGVGTAEARELSLTAAGMT